MKAGIASVVAAITLAQGASSSPLGTWRGTSTCLVRPSACTNEVVVYRITRLSAADSVWIDALKIVDGEEQEMGALRCGVATAAGLVTCAMPNGTWRFAVRGDSLTGELRLPDKTKFRDVRAARAR
jgi:hypothetical protein